MKFTGIVLILFLLPTAVSSAERRRDPLTPAEAEQLRAVGAQPSKCLNLLIKFTKARIDSIDRLRSDPKPAEGRGRKIHDLLEDFTAIMDEINDTLDQHAGRPLSQNDRKDFQKGLREVIEAIDKFDLKLRTLQSANETDPQAKKEAAEYQFVLADAQEALKSSADMAREYLTARDSTQKK
jgi:soluble cytochrome b562